MTNTSSKQQTAHSNAYHVRRQRAVYGAAANPCRRVAKEAGRGHEKACVGTLGVYRAAAARRAIAHEQAALHMHLATVTVYNAAACIRLYVYRAGLRLGGKQVSERGYFVFVVKCRMFAVDKWRSAGTRTH